MIETSTYSISGGDYEKGGTASRDLKEKLKKLGVDPAAIRRAMVAAYEAEMNVVIHAVRGTMRVSLEPGRIDVVVEDEGPGIADLSLAMKEGYSTAPDKARQLGFGAGMGLPNIKKNSNHFDLQSTVGRGTTVSFSIIFLAPLSSALTSGSLQILAQRCNQCRRCLWSCPTQAVRLRGRSPEILKHLCLECTQCIGSCGQGVFSLAESASELIETPPAAVLLPDAFLSQFGPHYSPSLVLHTLKQHGVSEIHLLAPWEQALRQAVYQHASMPDVPHPVISPACPAVVQWIELRFPSLLPHVAPFLSPAEAALSQLSIRSVSWMPLCPAQRTAVVSTLPAQELRVIHPTQAANTLAPLLKGADQLPKQQEAFGVLESPPPPIALQVFGTRHVLQVLNGVENGCYPDIGVIEPMACELGCIGSGMLPQDPFTSQFRSRLFDMDPDLSARAAPRLRPIQSRQGLRLDPHLPTAVLKLGQINDLLRELSKKDCGLCGAPSCAAFAEDVVLGRCSRIACNDLAAKEENKS